MKIYRYLEVESTQKIAKKLIDSGIGERSVIVADKQTEGRGRLERTWISPKGGLYCSIILGINRMLPIISGVVITAGFKKININALIKWPNDIIVNKKKIAGVLIETYKGLAIVGIGINVQSAPLDTSLSLWDIGHKVSRESVLNNLLADFTEILRFSTKQLLAQYRNFSLTLGKCVKIQTGETIIEGYAYDIAEDGGLLIKRDNTVMKVMAGDCIHLHY
jgi:BirA family biotin operon repressor/biotin-[acetyl-CoA-carboxylase] ligase